MPIPLSVGPYVIGASSVVLILLAAFLWKRPTGGRASARLLAGFLAAYALSNLGLIPSLNGIAQRHPTVLDAFSPLFFLIGPLLYFYVVSRVKAEFRFRPAQAVHLIPFLLAVIGYGVLFLKAGHGAVPTPIPHGAPRFEPGWLSAYWAVRVLMIVVYAILSLWTLTRKTRTSPDPLAPRSPRPGRPQGLSVLVLAYGSAAVAGLISDRFGFRLDLPIHIWMALAVTLLGFLAVFKPGRATDPSAARVKYAKSPLRPDEADRIERLLVAMMESDRVFLDPDLSLAGLAEKTGASSGAVSQVLNVRMGKSFRDFVNGYRVEEARRLLRDPRRRDMTILAVALESGFNSKVVFNRVFKKLAGTTPSRSRL